VLQFVNFSIIEINSNSVLKFSSKMQHNEIVIEILSYPNGIYPKQYLVIVYGLITCKMI